MLRVHVTSDSIHTFNTSAKEGKQSRQMAKQTIYVFEKDATGFEKPYPVELDVFVDRNEQTGQFVPYAPGQYFVAAESFELIGDKYKNLGVGKLRLRPLSEFSNYCAAMVANYKRWLETSQVSSVPPVAKAS